MQREMPVEPAVDVDGNALGPELPFTPRATAPGRMLELASREPMLPIDGIVVEDASRSRR
jgi:hypothetical protein